MHKRILSAETLSALTSELALLLEAGLPPAEAIAILKDGTENKKEADVLRRAVLALENGATLADALLETGAFPTYVTAMCAVGEASGRLAAAMRALGTYYARAAALRAAVRQTVRGPFLLLCMMLLVSVLLVVKVLPIFADVYASLGTSLSGAALAALRVGDFLKRHFLWLIPLFAAAIALLVFLVREGRLPFARRIRLTSDRARAAAVLAMCVKSGMDISTALAFAKDVCADRSYADALTRCADTLAQSGDFAASAEAHALFDAAECRLLAVGMRAGAMDEVLDELAARTAAEADAKLERVLGAAEPALAVISSILAGLILLSVMLPLLDVMSVL